MFTNIVTLQIIPRNEVPGKNKFFKVIDTLSFEKKRKPNYKKKQQQKTSSTYVFLLHYEPLRIRKPDIFIIRGISEP